MEKQVQFLWSVHSGISSPDETIYLKMATKIAPFAPFVGEGKKSLNHSKLERLDRRLWLDIDSTSTRMMEEPSV